MATGLSFAGNSLQTANILTNTIDHFSIPTKNLSLFSIAHANKSAIPFVAYPSKTIVVSGIVIDDSIAALDSRLDTFRNYFIDQEQNLDIDYNGSTRRYTATVNSLTIDRPGGLLYANFTIEFICTDPFGFDTSTSSAISATGRTNAVYSDAYTFLGTAPYQQLVITITINSITSSGSQMMTVGNDDNGQAITISRSTWAASDVIVIDCVNKTVTINNVATDFTGAFPEFKPGARHIGYTDTFSARNFDISAVYNPRYL